MLGNMYQYPYQPAPQPMPQYQQAYQPQMPQYQQRQFSPITGRIVSNAEEITVQEVPTDGSIAWFPSADGSCVYGKRWTPDGNITTMRFVPETVESAQPAPDPIAELNGKVDQALGMLAAMQPQGRSNRRSKVVSDDAE